LSVAVHTGSWPDAAQDFTLRASWSAAYPFDVHLHFGRDGLALLTAVNYGVPVPGKQAPATLPITLTLERLYWGILPESVVPTLIFLIIACSASAYWVAPKVHAHALRFTKIPKRD